MFIFDQSLKQLILAISLTLTIIFLTSLTLTSFQKTHISMQHRRILIERFAERFKRRAKPLSENSLDFNLKSISSGISAITNIENYMVSESPPPQRAIQPSIEENQEISSKRKIYGGKGDPEHLGGFTAYDHDGVSHNLWNWMLGPLNAKSIIDVGCGKGISSLYFYQLGAKVLCVEGSHDAVEQSLLPLSHIVEHDFTRGPWWPDSTFDVAWSIEFLEHVGRQYQPNFFPVFHKAALIFATRSRWGGWHHVEVHEEWWWKAKFQFHGFLYSEDLTKVARAEAAIGEMVLVISWTR